MNEKVLCDLSFHFLLKLAINKKYSIFLHNFSSKRSLLKYERDLIRYVCVREREGEKVEYG